MALTYNWSLKTLKKQNLPALGVEGAVIQTHWELEGVDEEGNVGRFSGATPFDPTKVDPDNFTSYENLTEAQVLGWIQEVVNTNPGYKQHIEERIQQQIDAVKTPVEEVSGNTFPWFSNSGE